MMRKFGCADSFGTSSPFGMAFWACRANAGVRTRSTMSFAARVTSFVNSFVKKIGVSEIRKSTGHFSVSFTQRNSAAYFSGAKSALKRERSCGSISDRNGSGPALSGAEASHPTYFSRVRAICASEIKIRTPWRCVPPFHTKNLPRRITCSPLNQMSKSRPTQSICVLETQFAPVCSA